MGKVALGKGRPLIPAETPAEIRGPPSRDVREGNQAPGPSAPRPSQACTPRQTYRVTLAHTQAHTSRHSPTHTHMPSPPHAPCPHTPPCLSDHLPTLAPCSQVLSPEATCRTLLEELRLEAPQATRAFGGGISFGPRAMAMQEKGGEERSSFGVAKQATHPGLPPLRTSLPP